MKNKKMSLMLRSAKKGQAVITGVIFLLFSSLILVFGVSTPMLSQLRVLGQIKNSHQSFFAAEGAIEDATLRLKRGESLNASSLFINGAVADTQVLAVSGGKEILSIGQSSNHFRKLQNFLALGDGAAFHFGIQTGNGGFILGGNAGVYGNVYSNGSIVGDNGSFVTGSAVAASSSVITNVDVGVNGLGDAHANRVENSSVAGSLYCKSGTGNNKICDTSRDNPVFTSFPISQSDIDNWKVDAELGTTINGNYSVVGTQYLGPTKIIGNLTVKNGATLVMNDTVYVSGNIIFETNARASLAPSYAEAGGILMAGGYIDLSNNVAFSGSGQAGSYILLLSESDCPGGALCAGKNAIEVRNNVSAVVLNAQSGTIHFSNNAGANAAVAKTLKLDNNATITYQTGLVDLSFKSGPAGGYQVKYWAEVE